MNLEEMRARLEAILTELDEFGDFTTDDDQERFDALAEESGELRTQIEELERRNQAREELRTALDSPPADGDGEGIRAIPGDGAAAPPVPGMLGDPFDLSEMRYGASPQEWRSRATTAMEKIIEVPDEHRAEIVRKLEDHEHVSDPQAKLPQLILVTSHEQYRRAWVKAMAGREATWTPDEAAAVARVESMRAALGLTQSGFAAPAVVDATVILTSAGSTNSIRRVARVESITSNSWKPITSGGVAASFDAPLAEVSDDTPTLAQPEITAHKAQAFAHGAIEVLEDWAAIGAELGREFADAKDVLEGLKHVKGAGDGSNEPFGIETELAGGASEVDPATAEAFAVADVYATIEGVPPRFRRQGGGQADALVASFAVMAELSTINAMRQFATANNYHAFLTDLGGGQPAQLIGYRLYENSDMDPYSTFDAGATATNFLLLAGDFSKYVIVDRIGMSVEFIPHLFDTNANLPNGSRGWYAHWRTGAESIVDNAFRLLAIPTAA